MFKDEGKRERDRERERERERKSERERERLDDGRRIINEAMVKKYSIYFM